jgi:hypothetical protein
MPENGYLKALAVGGAALPPGAVIDLSRGVSHLKITLSRNGGQVPAPSPIKPARSSPAPLPWWR